MRRFEIEDVAEAQLDHIFAYSLHRWGDEQARRYVTAIIETFDAITADRVPWRRIPTSFDIDGYVRKCGSHLIYWRCGADDVVRIVAVLHERMHQSLRLREALDAPP